MAAAVSLIGCGEGSGGETSPQRSRLVNLTLEGYPGAQNVGVLMAEKRGYFEEAGLLVDPHVPVYPGRPITYVANGSVDISISHLPQLVLAREKGVPVVAIGSVVPEPTAAMIWLRNSDIDGIADLKGRTIATPGLPFQKDLLQSVLATAGLTLGDVRLENARYDLLPELLSGHVDAIFGGSGNVEGAELEARGLDPVVTSVRGLDVPSYEELVVFARRDRLAGNPELFSAFMSALARGTAAAIEDPVAATAVVAERERELSRDAARTSVEATLPLLSESGRMSAARAGETIDWMREEGMVKRPPRASELLTNDYLPQPE